jgi:hypothetical protein
VKAKHTEEANSSHVRCARQQCKKKYLPDHIRYIHSADGMTLHKMAAKRKEEEKEGEGDRSCRRRRRAGRSYHDEHGGQRQHRRVPQMLHAIKDRYGMRRHFMHRHLNDKIIIEEEANSRCELRNVRTPQSSSPTSKTCKVGTIRKDQRDMRREQYKHDSSNSISDEVIRNRSGFQIPRTDHQ